MSEQPAPRSPELLRVGDRERAEAAERLSAHAAAGRLSIEELEQRLDAVHAAVLARELDAVEADLPTAIRRGEPSRSEPRVAFAIAVLLAAVLATIVVGHPVPPLFLAAVFLWRGAARRRHASIRTIDQPVTAPRGRSSQTRSRSSMPSLRMSCG
jgi:hypothetical protein